MASAEFELRAREPERDGETLGPEPLSELLGGLAHLGNQAVAGAATLGSRLLDGFADPFASNRDLAGGDSDSVAAGTGPQDTSTTKGLSSDDRSPAVDGALIGGPLGQAVSPGFDSPEIGGLLDKAGSNGFGGPLGVVLSEPKSFPEDIEETGAPGPQGEEEATADNQQDTQLPEAAPPVPPAPSGPPSGEGGAGTPPGGGGGGDTSDGSSGGTPPAGPPDAQTQTAEEQTDESAPTTPREDPAFESLEQSVRQAGQAERTHEPAAAASGAAQAAATSPPQERTSLASATQAAATASADTPAFDAEAFVAKVMQKVQASAPRNMMEARSYTSSGRLDATRGELQQTTQQQTQRSVGPLETANQTPPDPGTIPERRPEPLQEQAPGPPPTPPHPTGAAPPSQPLARVVGDTQAVSADIDRQMAEEEITDETLANSNEPEFLAALNEKQAAQDQATAAPAEFRQEETEIAGLARTEGQIALAEGTSAMHSDRATTLGLVTQGQRQTMSADETTRAAIAGHIEQIYQRTKQRVDDRLTQLDRDVDAAFSAGIDQAKQAFEAHYDAAMEARYSGAAGALQWLEDKVFGGLVGAVAGILRQAQGIFVQQMTAAVRTVSQIVATGLTEAKGIVDEGRAQITEYVASLPEELRAIGQESASAIDGRFSELETSIDDKENQLVETLATRYVDALSEINQRMEAIRDASRSLLERARDRMAGVMSIIRDLKSLIMSVVSSVGDAIRSIIRDPIGFLGNLVSSARQGLQDFVSGVRERLRNTFQEWLSRAASEWGIELPERFDAEGIFSIVRQVLGMTYQGIRARAVALVGEPMVERLERLAEPFITLINEGPGALWEWIQEKVGSIAETVFEGIQSFVVDQVVKPGIALLKSMLNPASPFIRAAQGIYRVVASFIERVGEIAGLAQAFVAGVVEMAGGAVGALAGRVKDALIQALPLVIDFLGRLLGLGGVGERIRETIDRAQAPVQRAIDWLIGKSVDMVRAAGGLVGIAGENADESSDDTGE